MPPKKINRRWTVDFRFDGKRYRKVAPQNTRASAISLEHSMRRDLEQRAPQAAHGQRYQRYSDFAEDWFRTYVIANNRPSEQLKKRGHLSNHILPHFGSLPLEAISEREIEVFKADRLRLGYSPKTVKNMQTVLRKSLQCAVDWGVLNRVPKFTWVKTPKTEISCVSAGAERLLLNYQSNPVWTAMITLALRSGMRLGEMLALRWRDLDFREDMISVNGSINILHERAPTKNGRDRTIPLSTDAGERIKELRGASPPRDGYVFDRGDGQPYRCYIAHDRLQKIARELGIKEPVHWHRFRHTFATNLAKQGVSMRILQDLLGHSTITMTERYSHVDVASKRDAIHRLSSTDFNEFGQKMDRKAIPPLLNNKTEPKELALLS